jgi:hypothetical protein
VIPELFALFSNSIKQCLQGGKTNVQKKDKHILFADRRLDDGISINGSDGCLTV